MSINIGYSCSRYVFFLVNVLFWVLGCGSLGLGIWLYVVKTEYTRLTPPNYGALSEAGLCIAAGATIVVVTFIGWGGAWVQSKCLLITYFVLVLIVFVVELTSGILSFLYRDEITETIRNELFSLIHNPNAIRDPRVITTWDQLQTDFECCGVDKFEDWYGSPRWPEKKMVPYSCCHLTSLTNHNLTVQNCGKVQNSHIWFQQGCFEAFSAWLLQSMHIVGMCGLVFAILQIFGLVAAILLYCNLRDRQHSSCRYHQQT